MQILPDPHKGGLYMSHVATGEHVETPLVGVRQHERNRFFIKNSQALTMAWNSYSYPMADML